MALPQSVLGIIGKSNLKGRNYHSQIHPMNPDVLEQFGRWSLETDLATFKTQVLREVLRTSLLLKFCGL
jgi:hypothetical protein